MGLNFPQLGPWKEDSQPLAQPVETFETYDLFDLEAVAFNKAKYNNSNINNYCWETFLAITQQGICCNFFTYSVRQELLNAHKYSNLSDIWYWK